MNAVFAFLLIGVALLLFISVANNSWMNIWDRIKSKEPQSSDTSSSDTSAPQPAPTGGPF